MSIFEIVVATSLLCMPNLSQDQTSRDSAAGAPTIIVTKLDVTDEVLKLSYEIRNTSEHDIWVCEGTTSGYKNFEVDMVADGQTLLIRRRSDVPMSGFGEPPTYRYVGMSENFTQKESLLLSLPVRPRRVLLGGRRSAKVIEYAKRLVIEIGFYSGDLPGMIVGMLEEAEKDPQKKHEDDIGYPTDAIGWLSSSVYFNRINEGVLDRDEQVVVVWTNQTLKGEQVIRTAVDNLRIPYVEDPSRRELRPQNLSVCTRVEIKYEPSMLDYFFPSAARQHLLSVPEIKYLESHEMIVVDDQELIRSMADEISEGFCGGQIVTESRLAHVTCYRGNEHLTSFTVYGDASLETEDKQYLWYRRNPQGVRMLTQQVKPFELRMQCAVNLVDLWHRLRLYYKTEKMRLEDSSAGNQIVYPAVDEWCDVMLRAYQIVGPGKSIMRAHICPSAGEGECHYAINPNCKFDSPPDMVLLFETKAGWNRHGGRELFTFDNHDPKGGCVLLNDGTVKFIRTAEELRRLRWE
jgi:hypothetical protein